MQSNCGEIVALENSSSRIPLGLGSSWVLRVFAAVMVAVWVWVPSHASCDESSVVIVAPGVCAIWAATV